MRKNIMNLKFWLFGVLALGLIGCVTTGIKGIVVPAPMIKGAEFVGSETCATCHEKVSKDFERTTHSRLTVSSEEIKDQSCEACHGAGSLHVDAEGKQEKAKTIVNPGKSPEACYKCHLKQKAEFSLQYHHPLPEGKITCTDCHDPHGAEGMIAGTAKSLEGKNEVCAKCHIDQTRPFVFEHEALREGCSICHNAHGSINDKMLKERDSNLCVKCHYQANFATIGKQSHVSFVKYGTCWNCHTAPHGSNFSRAFRL